MPKAELHTLFMRRCLELAKLGLGNVSPNPMVGAVLVYDDRIIGEGYHQKYGEAHAEVNAINSVKPEDIGLISKSTLYVSLEPCNHHGKTPPCSDLIIRSQIPKVVIACVDSYSEVAGKGIERLRKNGIEVEVGVLEEEARDLNKRFFTYHEKKRTYIILKWAQTLDGFLDKRRDSDKAEVNWITQPETQQITHQWRSEEDAILVGHQTIISDNPSLTVRAVSGRNPVRIVLSKMATLPTNSKILDGSAKTVFIDSKTTTFDQIIQEIYDLEIQSLIIEGGKKTLELFLTNGIWDEARVLKGTNKFYEGIKAPNIEGTLNNQFTFGQDIIEVYLNG